MSNNLKALRDFISGYLFFAETAVVKAIALWIAATYMFESFDAFPYMVITAKTKRAGKTRLSELIGFSCSNPFKIAGDSASAMFRTVEERKPTVIIDEAEALSKETAGLMRTFLNVGYRKGQSIPKTIGNQVREFSTYCPKVFVMIGGAFDTLMDRSIIVSMQRGEPGKRFSYEQAKQEGNAIGEILKAEIEKHKEEIYEAYLSQELPFLNDRDEEIWRPIFAVASVLDKETYNELKRIAVDMATEKTGDIRKYNMSEEDEKRLQSEDDAKRLLSDMLALVGKSKNVPSATVIEQLKAIDVAPWRKYKGIGLDMNELSRLVAIYGLRPKPCRDGEKVFRGYKKAEIEAAIKKAGIL